MQKIQTKLYELRMVCAPLGLPVTSAQQRGPHHLSTQPTWPCLKRNGPFPKLTAFSPPSGPYAWFGHLLGPFQLGVSSISGDGASLS